MVSLLRHPVAGLVMFAFIIGLFGVVYSEGLEGVYGVTEQDLKNLTIGGVTAEGSIMDHFERLNLLSGINEISDAIVKLKNPLNPADLVGGLILVGTGALKTVVGIVTFPFDILAIIGAYYVGVDALLIRALSLLIVYVGFILLSVYIGKDV